MSLQLGVLPLTYGEREYLLRCNMNVLAEVQEAHGGDLLSVLQGSTLKSVLEFTAAMMNDYADEMGWPERVTAKEIGRKLKFEQRLIADVMGLVTAAITPAEKKEKN